MATLNTAEHFGMARDMGMIAPGRYADVLLVSDLAAFEVESVIAKGKQVAENGELLVDMPAYSYPGWATQSVKLEKALTSADFVLPAEIENGRVLANVIGIIENQAPTKHLRMQVEVVSGQVPVDMEKDLAKVALVERHTGSGRIQVGLVSGFGFTQPCGLATTVAHDSHQMIVVGTSEADMALAANKLAEIGGGQVVVRGGEVIGMVELPIAGLMSNQKAEVVAEKAATVLQGFIDCGCRLHNPNMQLSFLGLVVIPELRLSDLGLVDVTKFDFIPVLEA
jgi:adenine deaminase